MEDQRRRTLEALERRFSQAEAEVQSQQQKSKKWPAGDKKKIALPVETLSADSPVNKPLPKPSSRKGFQVLQFFSVLILSDVTCLPWIAMHSTFLFRVILIKKVSDGKIRVDWVLHELFQHGDSAQKYMKGSRIMKIENTILLDNFVQKSGRSSDGHLQALQQGSKRSKKHLSLKQHKRIGSFDLPKEFHKGVHYSALLCSLFDLFKPMREKWTCYVQQLLKIVGKEQLAQCFLNADLHGAVILVVQCKIVSHVGIHGIMVRETKETFGIVTHENKFKVVPKKLSVFALLADCWKITLHGDRLVSRNLVL